VTDLKNSKLSELIEQFELAPHPEGGWYREVIRSDLKVKRGTTSLESFFS